MQVCRICLNIDRKMYLIYSNRVHLYEQLTGATFASQDLLPKYVCWECDHYMSKYVAFRSKAIKSLCILNEILSKEGLITQTNCIQYHFKSNLTSTDVFTDVNIDTEDTFTLLEPSSEVKIENDSFENNINNLTDVKCDLALDFIDNNQYSDEVVLTDDLMPSPLSNEIVENKDSVEEKRKSPKKLSCIKNKRKKKICQVNDNCENNSSNKIKNETLGLVSVKKKRAAVVKEKKFKSDKDEIDTEMMKVTVLTLDEQIAEVQNRKESDNYKNSPYKCEKCFKGFVDSDAFDRHKVKHSEAEGAFLCPLCETRFNLKNRLTKHMKTHMYKFSCQECNFCARSIEVAKKHESYHRGKRHTCPHCNEVYTYRNSLLSHIRIKHPSDAVCSHCGLSFLNDKGVKQHIKWAHRFEEKAIPEGGPRCERCDVTFSSQAALDNHTQVSPKHADERGGEGVRNAMKSIKCKASAKNSVKKLRHTSELYPDGLRSCEQCDEKLPSPRAYYLHFRAAHKDKNRTFFYKAATGERHMCEVCGRLFQSASLLRRHKFLHSETKQFKCERCGKQFQLEFHLWSHKRNHCGTRVDYPCSVCGKKFSSICNRSRHMVVHKGLRYKCELCDKVFNCPGNKKNHIDFVHKKKPWPKRNRGPRRRPEIQQPESTLQNPPYEANMQEEWNTP